jgi:transposase-like protein
MKLVTQERLSPEKKAVSSIVKPLFKEEEEKYEQVRDYIINYPKASVAQIAEAIDISPSKLFEWIRDERLEFSEESQFAWFECEICGTKIKSGRLCNRCKFGRK